MKIKNLVVLLMTLITVSSATVSASGDDIPVETALFPITINLEHYNNVLAPAYSQSDPWIEGGMIYFQYPMFVYNEIVYFPLTYHNCNLVGLTLEMGENHISVRKSDLSSPMLVISEEYEYEVQRTARNLILQADNPYYWDELAHYGSAAPFTEEIIGERGSFSVSMAPYSVDINGVSYNDEAYPILFRYDIIYIPLTWDMVNNILDWDYTFDENGMELYTESYYFTRTFPEFGNLMNPGKTYYYKDGLLVRAETRGTDTGPEGLMTISKDGIEKTVPGYTGFSGGFNVTPLFTIDGDYIYTTHTEERSRLSRPCKISIETGEMTYLDDMAR